MPLADINGLERVLVIGSTLRKDHPLIAQRFRQVVKRRCEFNLINPVDDDLFMRIANKAIVAPNALADTLAQVLKALADAKGVSLSGDVGVATKVTVSEAARAIAENLAKGGKSAILLGNLAEHHPQRAMLHRLAQEIASIADAGFGFLGEAANSVGGFIANAMPTGGNNVRQMLATPRKGYLLLGVEAELDFNDSQAALKAVEVAEMVVAMSAYKQHKAQQYADVLLPISPFTETAGTFVSTEGRVQNFNGAVKPLGDTRPAWKVLRVLGNLLGLSGFEYDDVEAIRRDIGPDLNDVVRAKLGNKLDGLKVELNTRALPLQRIGEVPIYQADAIVRRAASLQKTRDALPPVAAMNGALLQRIGVKGGDDVCVQQGDGSVVMKASQDDKLPDNCVRVAAGHPLTAMLGSMFGEMTVQRVVAEQVA
jgi:NADH-quinone oxidoreductase subunit G